MSARPIALRISTADELRNVLARVIVRRHADGRPVPKDLLERFTAADLQHRQLCRLLGEQLGVKVHLRD